MRLKLATHHNLWDKLDIPPFYLKSHWEHDAWWMAAKRTSDQEGQRWFGPYKKKPQNTTKLQIYLTQKKRNTAVINLMIDKQTRVQQFWLWTGKTMPKRLNNNVRVSNDLTNPSTRTHWHHHRPTGRRQTNRLITGHLPKRTVTSSILVSLPLSKNPQMSGIMSPSLENLPWLPNNLGPWQWLI